VVAHTLEIRRVPCGPLGQVWNARVDDWIEDGSRIIRLSREYRRHYRETVCAKCTPEEQERRGCSVLSERDNTRSCDHMNRAFYSRHREIIRARMASHPLVERIRLNAQLGGGARAPRSAHNGGTRRAAHGRRRHSRERPPRKGGRKEGAWPPQGQLRAGEARRQGLWP